LGCAICSYHFDASMLDLETNARVALIVTRSRCASIAPDPPLLGRQIVPRWHGEASMQMECSAVDSSLSAVRRTPGSQGCDQLLI